MKKGDPNQRPRICPRRSHTENKSNGVTNRELDWYKESVFYENLNNLKKNTYLKHDRLCYFHQYYLIFWNYRCPIFYQQIFIKFTKMLDLLTFVGNHQFFFESLLALFDCFDITNYSINLPTFICIILPTCTSYQLLLGNYQLLFESLVKAYKIDLKNIEWTISILAFGIMTQMIPKFWLNV